MGLPRASTCWEHPAWRPRYVQDCSGAAWRVHRAPLCPHECRPSCGLLPGLHGPECVPAESSTLSRCLPVGHSGIQEGTSVTGFPQPAPGSLEGFRPSHLKRKPNSRSRGSGNHHSLNNKHPKPGLRSCLSCVTPSKSLNLSVPHCPHLCHGDHRVPTWKASHLGTITPVRTEAAIPSLISARCLHPAKTPCPAASPEPNPGQGAWWKTQQ